MVERSAQCVYRRRRSTAWRRTRRGRRRTRPSGSAARRWCRLAMAAAGLKDLDLQLADPQRHLVLEHHVGQVRPGTESTAWNKRGKRPISIEIRLAALHDQIVGVAARDDLLGAVGRSAQHAHRMIVRQQDVPDRLVGDLADARDDVLRHDRGRLRVDHHNAVVADDDAGVRVAFRRVGISIVRQLVEGDLLLCQGRLATRISCSWSSPLESCGLLNSKTNRFSVLILANILNVR